MTDLGPIQAARRNGGERLVFDGKPLASSVGDFWAWSTSDLITNSTRGVFAEFIVAAALGVAEGVREPWAAWDLTSRQGTKVEVKSAGYIQSWHQKRLSTITFGIRRTRNWTAETGMDNESISRLADVYVFALLAAVDQRVIDPLELNQWEFYVVPTSVLEARTRSQHSITLPTLRKLTDPIGYSGLAEAIESAGTSSTRDDPSRRESRPHL